MIRASVSPKLLKLAGKRTIATANSTTKYATLSSGVTVASEINPYAKVSTIGLWFGAGSRSEHALSNGVSALTTNLLGSTVENGVLLSAENSKETNGIVANTTSANIYEAAKLISNIGSNATSLLEKADLQLAKKNLTALAQEIENTPSRKVLEHLNASAFQGYSLGLPTYGTVESIEGLQLQDSERLLDRHLVGSNVVVAASGNFDHDKLVETLEAGLSIKQGHKPATKPATFLGSEIKMRDDTLPKAYVSLAAQGEGVSSPAYYVAQVATKIFGDFDYNAIVSKFTSPKLASQVQEYHIVDKYTHFSTSYSDTGLWGFNAEISNIFQIDDFVYFTLKQWNRLSISVTDAEVERAKQQTKAALLANLNSTEAIASDIANKVLLLGYRNSVKEALEKIDAIKTKDVKAWAQAALWDKDIVVSGTGQIESLLDYNRWRNNMAMMRW